MHQPLAQKEGCHQFLGHSLLKEWPGFCLSQLAYRLKKTQTNHRCCWGLSLLRLLHPPNIHRYREYLTLVFHRTTHFCLRPLRGARTSPCPDLTWTGKPWVFPAGEFFQPPLYRYFMFQTFSAPSDTLQGPALQLDPFPNGLLTRKTAPFLPMGPNKKN